MTIEASIEALTAQLAALTSELVSRREAVGSATAPPPAETPPVKKTRARKSKKTDDTPAADTPADTSAVGLPELRDAFTTLLRDHGAEVARGVLDEFGVNRISLIPEDRRADAMERIAGV